MDYGLQGKGAVVTGADSGIGYETAKLLLQEGARVFVTDRDRAAIEAAAGTLAAHGDVKAAAADLTDFQAVQRLRDEALAQLGAVDILIHAAGVTGATGLFHEIDDAGWLKTLDTDFMGAVRVVRAFVTGMAEQGSGRIVLFGSEDGEQPYIDELPYCAAKSAIFNLSKGLSKTYAKQGVLVNAVSPAFIATPMTDAMMQKRAEKNGTSFEDAVTSFLREERPTLDLQRRGQAGEVAAAALFLCSQGASFTTGSILRVDGGSVASW